MTRPRAAKGDSGQRERSGKIRILFLAPSVLQRYNGKTKVIKVGLCLMETRVMKFYSKESNLVAMHAIPGHFATSHSHINYYIDITSLKTRVREAEEIARVLYHKIGRLSYIDTIVCMDGT